MRRRHRLELLAVATIAASGCDGCPGPKPYTPYTLDGSASATPPGTAGPAAVDVDASAPDAGPRFAVVQGVKAPGDGRVWPLPGGRKAEAPTGRAFDVGLVQDLDGDGAEDLLAWAAAPDKMRGELWFVPAAAPESRRTVLALPPDMSARACDPAVSVARVGPRTAAVEIALKCPRAAKEPERWLAVVRLPEGAAAPGKSAGAAVLGVLLELRVSKPPAAETVTLAVDGSDLDGDGRDDVTTTVTLGGAVVPFAPAAPASAIVRYFDRPGGLSRDPSEPESSLRARAAVLVGEARRKQSAVAALASTRQLRRLRASLCEDDRAGALISSTAGAIRCAETRSVEDIAHAEGLAALTLRDPARALAAVARLAALSGPAGPRRKELERQIAKEFGEIAAVPQHTVAAVPSGKAGIELGPLAFEPSGDLLVRTDGRTVRVAAAGFAESNADDVPPWPRAVTAPTGGEGIELTGIEQRCQEPTLIALVRAGGSRSEVALPVLGPVTAEGAPSAGPCAPVPSVRGRVLDAAAGGLVVSVGAELASISPVAEAGAPPLARPVISPLAAGPTTRGTARSPDGATVALETARGVLVWGADAKVWTGPFERAWGCVPANGGTRVACVVEGKAVVYGK
jgi:hypothetical protein